MTDAVPGWALPHGLRPENFTFLGREEMFDVWHDLRDADLLLVTEEDTGLLSDYEYIHARDGKAYLGDIANMDPLSMCIAHQILEKYYDGGDSRSESQSESCEAAEG